MKINRGVLLIFTFMVMACESTPKVQTKYIEVTKTRYPELAPISHPVPMALDACEWKKPKRRDVVTIIHGKKLNGKKCADFSQKEQQTVNFKSHCLENPIDTDAEIIYGFDQDNWNCFRTNMTAIRMLLKQYKERIDHVNQQRADWIKKNNASSITNTVTGGSDD